MTRALVTMGDLAALENDVLAGNARNHEIEYGFANDALSLISTGITGYSESRRVFGSYLSQIAITGTLALLSALRQHKTQVYLNLRLALEHTCLSAYALANPDDPYFKSDPNEAAHGKFMTKTVYRWLASAHPAESDEIERVKGLINNDHSHANIINAMRNIKPIDGDTLGVSVEFIDPPNAESISADLFHIGYVIMLALNLIGTVNNAEPQVRISADFDDEYRRLYKLGDSILVMHGRTD